MRSHWFEVQIICQCGFCDRKHVEPHLEPLQPHLEPVTLTGASSTLLGATKWSHHMVKDGGTSCVPHLEPGYLTWSQTRGKILLHLGKVGSSFGDHDKNLSLTAGNQKVFLLVSTNCIYYLVWQESWSIFTYNERYGHNFFSGMTTQVWDEIG